MTKECFVHFSTDRSEKKDFYRFSLPMGLTPGEYEYYICKAEGTLDLNVYDPRKSTIEGKQIEIYDQGVAQVGKITRKGQILYNVIRNYEQYQN